MNTTLHAWEDAAALHLGALFAAPDRPTPPTALAALTRRMEALSNEFYDNRAATKTISEHWTGIGTAALALAEHHSAPMTHQQCLTVLAAKNAAYGPMNVWRFTRPGRPGGLIVRVFDKVSRLENLITINGGTNDEPLTDTMLDTVNYCTIGLMVEADHFLLPMRTLDVSTASGEPAVAGQATTRQATTP